MGTPPVRRVWVALTDHYEPYWKNKDEDLARERVARWSRAWPEIARRHADSVGQPPKYTFFYPEEEYRTWHLDALAAMTAAGIADVEVHLHHDADTEQHFCDLVSRYLETLHTRHGLLRKEDGRLVFGFIHGNWALDNSRPDGRWCGLNNEITLLERLGCYADFTMPSGPSPTQARQLNRLYWAVDDTARPKSYDRGPLLGEGPAPEGALLMIPGPFALRWEPGRPIPQCWLPKIEIGEMAGHLPMTQARLERWLTVAPRLGGEMFIKLFAHGAAEKNATALLDGQLEMLFSLLEGECARRGLELRYVTAYEMRRQALAAAGLARDGALCG